MNKQSLIKKMNAYERLMRLDKPIGMFLLLWPTLWGLLLAGQGHPSLSVTIIFFAGVILMRSAGCVMNDLADQRYDGHVERTKNRPLVAGEVSKKEAIYLFLVLCLVAFLFVLFLNKLTILLSIGALFLAASYPLTKRFLVIPQAYLGIAFGFGIPMAFAAINNQIGPIAWWLLIANTFWAVAYDTEYAMVDRDDDVNIGIQSSALFFGRYDVTAIMFCYIAMLSIFGYIGQQLNFGFYYFLSIMIAISLIGWQYTMIKERIKEKCFKAFLANNWIGLALFVGILAEYYLNIFPPG